LEKATETARRPADSSGVTTARTEENEAVRSTVATTSNVVKPAGCFMMTEGRNAIRIGMFEDGRESGHRMKRES
jgi:hypothetical protein